jgi:signal transduction histidine kinase/DNA-binding response OmpR family regulator
VAIVDDWSTTGLGPRESWPVALRVLVDTCLESEFPMQLAWGPDLLLVYNEAFIPLLGADKHPWALGRPARQVLPDLFPRDRSDIQELLRGGGAVTRTDQQLIMNRHGYPEETYFTYSQSIIRDENGDPAGLFNAITETTEHVLYERRLRVLRALGAVSITGDGKDPSDAVRAACRRAVTVLSGNRRSVPLAVVFLRDEQDRPSLAEGYGFDTAVATDRGWLPVPPVPELFDVLADGPVRLREGLRDEFGAALLPGPVGPLLPDQAVLLPILVTGQSRPYGVLVVGVNPYTPVNEGFMEFAELAARQFGIILSDAIAYELERSRLRALADLDQAKSEFLQQVSHELRSPLTLLLPPLQELLGERAEPLPEQARTAIEAAVRAAHRLERMVDTLLQVARADDGALEPDRLPTDIGAATTEIADGFAATAAAAGLTLTVKVPVEPVVADVDPAMWTTIVTNLLGNAVKYTDRGGITMVMNGDDEEVTLTVTDTGVGIAPADIDNVFGRFHQLDASRPGIGLGLTLVKDLTEAHGGRVTVTSDPGHGSVFTVALPASTTAREETAGPAAGSGMVARGQITLMPPTARAGRTDERKPAERGSLLLVEDDPDLGSYVAELLRRDGWTVRLTVDAETAIQALDPSVDKADDAPYVPDIIVTDVMLPGQSGLDLVTLLRHDPALERIPILVLTARAGSDAAVEAMAAGADDYVRKPFDAPELLARVRAHCSLNQIRETAIDSAEDTADNLRRALATNRTIATAIGIVMTRYQLDATRSYQALVRISQHTNRKLRDLAAEVVDTGALPPAETGERVAGRT